MKHAENPWDALAPQPNPVARESAEPMQWYDADNVLLAEPVILEYLATRAGDPADARLLDFGCGEGRFTGRLAELGYKAEGMDSSVNMVVAARAGYGEARQFAVGDSEALPGEPTYDIITAVMVMQFIPEVGPAMQRLAAALKPGGSLVLAVFNPEFISDWIKSGNPDYVGFDSAEHPTHGTLLFGAVEVPVYLRTAARYNELAAQNGLALALEAYPPFTKEFLARYPVDGPVEHAEHMILCYQAAA